MSEMRQPLRVDPLVCAHGHGDCCLRCGPTSGEWLALSPMDAMTLLRLVTRALAPNSVHEWLRAAASDASAQLDECGQPRVVLPLPPPTAREEVAAWLAGHGLRLDCQLGGRVWSLASGREGGR